MQIRPHLCNLIRQEHRLHAIFGDSVDLSPALDGGVLKRVLLKGDLNAGFPRTKDSVIIHWKIWLANGSLVHSSTDLTEPFSFTLGASPREVIRGWELAVPSMRTGEVAELWLRSDFAFGPEGAPPLVPPSSDIRVELQLVQVVPSVCRSYRSVGLNESIREELLEGVQRGGSGAILEGVREGRDVGWSSSSERESEREREREREG